MTNTEAPAKISYVKAPKSAPAKIDYTKPNADSKRLSLTPGLNEVWLTGPRTGQRVRG